MGLLERVLEEEKKQKSQGLLKRANIIRTLSGSPDSPVPLPSSPSTSEDEKKNFPILEDPTGKTFRTPKKD